VGIPDGAAAALERYLEAVDAAVPGLVVGLHVVGSLALGDYHPDRSDIDIVAVVAHTPDPAARSLLAEIHRVVATRTDGPYIPAVALAGAPEAVGPVAFHVAGRFEFGDSHEVSPITWSILEHDALTVRGPSPTDLGVHADAAAVRAFSADNLVRYWASWASTIATVIEETDDDDTIEVNLLEWGVLGAARVHCAALTGRVVSKRDAGEYALEAFGVQWSGLVSLALDARERTIEVVRVGELRSACAFVDALVVSVEK
jgi:hypothetical protein